MHSKYADVVPVDEIIADLTQAFGLVESDLPASRSEAGAQPARMCYTRIARLA